MRKSGLAIAFLVATTVSGYAAAAQQLSSSDVIQGMGERIPAGKKNVSLSPMFKVYEFEKNGIKFIQVNSLKDEVLSVVSVTPGAQSVLPIGSVAEQTMIAVSDEKSQTMGMVTASASCPCNATVVYEDKYIRVVVIYGKDGTVINTITINKTPSTPKPGT